ncbi:unnamed protein product [Musa acuminata subsp. burmannicoides]
MADDEPQPLNYVQETVLKKRKNNEEWVIKKRERLAERKKSKESLKPAIKRPEEFVKEYRDKELDFVSMKQRLKLRKSSNDAIKSKLLLLLASMGESKDMHPRTRQILNKLRLRHILSGVFLKANEANLRMLLTVEPFITYGYPTLKSVRSLFTRRAVEI